MSHKILWNDDWFFTKEDVGLEGKDKIIEPITLPHTWNNLDGQDGGDNYVRVKAWYKKTFATPCDLKEDELYLQFDGANSIAEVYCNGVFLKKHEGGYSRFFVNITSALQEVNEILVSVDNRESKTVYPKFADFTFYGGIYRDVKLIRVSKSHFNLDYYGAPSVAITPNVNGLVKVDYYVSNPCDCKVELQIEGENIKESVVVMASDTSTSFHVENPRLWNGKEDPALYHLTAHLLKDNEIIDTFESDFGFREFKVDATKGFYLNGRSYPLRGVCRHQDRENMGNALTKKEHEEDMALIKEVGANTIRLAHYQHSDYFYDLCDQNGMIVWAEIPFISTKLEDGHENEMNQLRELILQNYNHPCIICWGLSNEVTISSDMDIDLLNRHIELNNFAHKLDPTRYTTMAQLSMLDIHSPLNSITDLRSYNIYYGWYGGEFEQNGQFMDKFHEAHPDLPFGISEYGCEAILKWHSDTPVQGDYTEEYQCLYHESLLKQIHDRPFLWATHLWNMFDFGSDMRQEGGVAGRNHKGLVTFDRKIKKDSFYLYKAYWSKDPFVHLCESRFVNREKQVVNIKVYSNLEEVKLLVNHQEVGCKKADKVFVFENINLVKGENLIEAISGDFKDSMILNHVDQKDMSYVYSEGDNVNNWFEVSKDCFSVDDKIKDILENEQGKALFDQFLAQASEKMKGFKLDDGMMKMAGNFTVRRIIKMAGKKVPEGTLEKLQSVLSKIKK